MTKIKELMDEKGISVFRMLKDTQITRSTIYALMNGKSDVKVSTALKIAKYLGTTAEELFQQ